MNKLKLNLFLILIVFISCRKNEPVIKIFNFKSEITDSLIPKKEHKYSIQYVKLKGTVDDSIWISFGKNLNKIYLVNEIDTIFRADYYGCKVANLIINPYKSKKSNLTIIHVID